MGMSDEAEFYRTMLAQAEHDFLQGVVIPEPYRVKLTCECVPEQWDIYLDDRQVGYLRCRFSRWSLEYPECGGRVLIAEPWHPERSRYESNFDEERPAIFERVFRALDEAIMAAQRAR